MKSLHPRITFTLGSVCLAACLLLQLATDADAKSFLWKVTSDTTTVYVLGSIHIAKEELYPLDRAIERAFEESNILVVEIDVEKADSTAAQLLMMQHAAYPPGDSLDRHIADDTYQDAKSKMAEYGLLIEQFHQFKPWFLSMTLTLLELQKLGFDPQFGIDRHFLGAARASKKIIALEDLDDQMSLFDNLPDEQQELFLKSTIIDLAILDEEMDRLNGAWLRGDVSTVEAVLTEGLREHPELEPVYETFFYQRNRDMTSKIEGYLNRSERYFVVVGAGHLVGKEGIIQLLRQKGYRIEQL